MKRTASSRSAIAWGEKIIVALRSRHRFEEAKKETAEEPRNMPYTRTKD